MTPSATGSSRSAEARLALAVAAALLLSACATQREAPRPASVTGDNVTAGDVAMTPIEDLNLKKDPIPPILLNARKGPYARDNTGTCQTIMQEMTMLNAVLGEDYDTADSPERKMTPEGVAQKIVAFLIPYRSVIREVSGANRNEWEFRQAISAGLMRRAYLKGRGEAMGCAYPARPYPGVEKLDPASFDDLPPVPEQPVDPRRRTSAGG